MRALSSEKVRKLLGRDLIPADDAISASAETLIRCGAVQAPFLVERCYDASA